MPDNFLPTEFQRFIHKSRYARWLPDKNRRETWPETVSRYFDFFADHLKENYNTNLDNGLRLKLETAVLSTKVMPSMRCLMTAGPALKRDNIAGYNCLAGETKVLTKEYGTVEIKSLVGKTCHILTSRKLWEPAIFSSFGKQKLYKITAEYNKYERTFFATGDHNWIINGKRCTTLNLKKNDILPFISIERKTIDKNSTDYKLGIIHGLVYGDGTATYQKEHRAGKQIYAQRRDKGYHIRLCGDHADLLPYFTEYPKSYPKSYSGDPVIYLYDDFAKTHQLKSIPSENETDNYLVGFFRGWLAADGYVSKDGQVSICTSSKEETWLRIYMPKLGYHFTSTRILPEYTNYGKRKVDSRVIHLLRPSLMSDDFLIRRKGDRFFSFDYNLKIKTVEETGRIENVYCATVETTHDFVLEGGILTGNCAYIAIDNARAFDEILYILLNGTGVGFSVERQCVNQLPTVAEDFYDSDIVIPVSDSKLGWAKAYKELIHLLYGGQIPKWDTSKVRAAGAPLKTFGGRASGPAPLEDLFSFAIRTFKNSQGRKLTSLECHDLVCKSAEIVVVGGVRRSALISLSNLSDERMRNAKTGKWNDLDPQRGLSNNSACYTEKPDIGIFMDEWKALYDSKSGERGIFNRKSARKQAAQNGRRNADFDYGTNPCSEIILRSRGFCNLSEVVVRANDGIEELKEKVELATLLGTFQSTLTSFRYISKKWQENCEEERLLGVSLTGEMDNPLLNGSQGLEKLAKNLQELKKVVIDTNKTWAKKLGINQSTATTCVKPSGTVSQLVDSASGIHPRHSHYYIRTVRADKKDPLAKMMVDVGFPVEDDVMKPEYTYVFSFPIKSPDKAIFRKNLSAIEHLEIWKTYQDNWCEHKPSITVSVREHEWLDVAAWVFKNFDDMSGVAFLPFSNTSYRQMPYQECTKEEYERLAEKMPKNVDWEQLSKYEQQDNTTASQELACTGPEGVCELK